MLEKKDIKKRKDLVQKVHLTNEQIKEVDTLWEENYGKKIPLKWHQLYTSYTGKFNKNYFPELFFKPNLLNKLNPPLRKRYLDDKTLLKSYFAGLEKECRILKNYVYNCSSYFYDEKGLISFEKAIEILYDIKEVIIKPSIDSDSGKNVRLLNIQKGIDVLSGERLEDILNRYRENYVVQERLKPHADLAKLYPNSINTIRINSYICDNQVYVSPIALRLGRNGNIVDNAHAGGIAVGVEPNGKLMKYAFSQKGEKFTKHPNTNVSFLDYEIPKIKEMIEFTKKYHYRIPHMGIIAWDLTVDEKGNIVILEANVTCPSLWFPQYCTGEGFFGENTEKMIRLLNK